MKLQFPQKHVLHSKGKVWNSKNDPKTWTFASFLMLIFFDTSSLDFMKRRHWVSKKLHKAWLLRNTPSCGFCLSSLKWQIFKLTVFFLAREFSFKKTEGETYFVDFFEETSKKVTKVVKFLQNLDVSFSKTRNTFKILLRSFSN